MTDGASESTRNFREGVELHRHLARAMGRWVLED